MTEFSVRSSQPLKILIIKKMCYVRTFVPQEYEIFFVHTYVTYKHVIWPNLCYTQKYDIKVCLHFFYICKCVMSFSVLLFLRIWTDADQNVPKADRVRFTCFSDLDLGLALPMINDIWYSLCLAHANSNVYA